MADTIREKILKNLVTTLQAVTVANGYNTTFKTVERLVANPIEANLPLPCMVVHDVDDTDQTGRDDAGGGAMGFETFRMGMVVEFWMRETSKGSLSSDLNAALGDIYKAVTVDWARGAGMPAIDTRYMAAITVLAQKLEPLGGMQVRFEVDYRFVYGDPTQG